MNTERPQYVRIIDEELAGRCATIREQTGCEGAFGFAYDVALKARTRVASLEMELDAKDTAISQKDATIKALAERLVTTSHLDNDGPCWCTRYRPAEHQARCLLFRDALRLAGVLK